jgi:hypothetical protein
MAIVNKNVPVAPGIRGKIGGSGCKCDVPAVGRYGRIPAVIVSRHSETADTYARGDAGFDIADIYVVTG